ncbi:uncharacterized protein A1O9_03949 [Exophiala aquamarina CBS 119918]|uniref:Heterokaryon incompatibility domain-containing protein n=1 Tax=Exophiala aquamarina CBS 119918 TaxID=1182545 RepID=A0A072PU84_9EURO|nr:uncharacterized protein A1O9_03949 [Exophiala aquamarina CBS 119918]KEF59105.1 hypothetical protein A1O9_03949 [Exophiala aquamarina CBS 119918]
MAPPRYGGISADVRTGPGHSLASRSSVCNQGNVVVREFKPGSIDFGIVKTWISQPISQPSSRIHRQSDLPERLIDWYSKRIVPAGAKKYVTLSYAWGNAMVEYDNVDSEGMLPEPTPGTVTDAIRATKRLGFRYLWVDKYCIDQKDGPGRLRQINHMDIIFKNSEVTIAAAAGLDVEFGLPGVGARPRKPQRSIHLHGASMMIVSTTKVLLDSICESNWNSRAWTFQEAHLSSKLLIFTEREL